MSTPSSPERLHCRYNMSHTDMLYGDPAYLKNRIRRHMIESVSSMLAERIQEVKGEYSTEYKLDVYVLTHDQLEKMVHEMAERRMHGNNVGHLMGRCSP